MAGDIRVTNLGYTGSGKTCHLLGMYHQMQVGLQGFSMRRQEPDDRSLEAQYEILEAGGKDRWPLPTAVFDDYLFDLEFKGDTYATVDWLDYRGGDINQLYLAPQAQQLFKRLSESTCVILTVSGEYLAEPMTVKNAVRQVRIQRMNELMSRLVQQVHPTHDRPLPVAILITKYDYCMASNRDEKDVHKDVMSLFNRLFAKPGLLTFRAPSYLTTICTVTMGSDLVSDLDNGQVSPKFMHRPLFFAAWATLKQMLADAEKGKENPERIEELRSKMSLIAETLKNLHIYQDGVEITP